MINSIKIHPSSITMRVGEWRYDLVARETSSNMICANMKWECNDDEITINEKTGYIHAIKAGRATVYVRMGDGSIVNSSCTVTVLDPILVNNITLSKTSVAVGVGETITLLATVSPSDATNRKLKWETDCSYVATVDSSGKITAHRAGEAIISAKSCDGTNIVSFCTVTVKQTSKTTTEQKPSNTASKSTVADPIDAFTGAHLLRNKLISLFGGQGLSLVAHYNSANLVTGSLGVGWYHNYEKNLISLDGEIWICNNPSSYMRFVLDENSIYKCTTRGKSGYMLSVDTANEEYMYCLNRNQVSSEYYNADGKLTKIVNHNAFEIIFAYSDSLTTITDMVTGKKIYIEKDSSGKIKKVYDDALRETVLTYDGDFLINISDTNKNNLSYAYDEEGKVIYGTDSNGVRYFENTYDEYGRVITQKDGVGAPATIFEYGKDGTRITTNRNGDSSTRVFEDNGLLVDYIDEYGIKKKYVYDSNFNITEEIDGNGNSKKIIYNNYNRPIAIIDKNGNKTTMTYDANGNVINITYPANNGICPEERFTYNSRNQIISHTDLRGIVTVYAYDANGAISSKKIGSKQAEFYVYENGMLKSSTDPKGNITCYGYNAIGQMTSKTDAKNNVFTYEYDSMGNLLKATDPNGKSVIYTYDCNNQKTSATDANGNVTSYAYNGNMKNTSITLPDGNVIRYDYDYEDRLVKTTDQAGNVTVNKYDKSGRIVSIQTPDDAITTYEYDNVGNVIKETTAKGAVIRKTYDAKGNVLSVTDHNDNTIRYQYDNMSRVIRKVSTVAGVTLYTYSNSGDLLQETNALGHKRTYTYDNYGNKLTFTDAIGNTTTYAYDSNNNLISVIDALGHKTSYVYNALNQLISVKDAKNNVITYGYDALGRKTTVTDANNNIITTTYDANGNVIKITDAKGNTVSESTYNNMNLPVIVTDKYGKTTAYSYNSIGKVATATDSLNNIQEYLYNTRGQNIQVKDCQGNISSTAYDVLGNLVRLTGPLGGNTEYSYDELGRLISHTTTSGGIVTYGYNEQNLKEQLTNARGQIRKYFYDPLGRIVGYVGEEDSVSYTYDANGNILTVMDSNGTITRTYDALNRVKTYTDTFGKTISYVYDSVGNLVSLIYPDNTSVSYEYDANRNLVKVTDWAGRITTYSYDVNNQVTNVVKPDGSVTIITYDSKHRVASSIEKTSSGTVITGYEYTYDVLGRIIEEKNLAKNKKVCYTYDNLSRVTSRTIVNMSDNSETQETYTYDAAGNIVGSSADVTFVYDTNNRLTSYNVHAITYDADGNMLLSDAIDESEYFEYDSANRLTSAGCQWYIYNAENVRIRSGCVGHDTIYTYDVNCKLNKLLQKTTNGTVTKYVYGRGLIGEEFNGQFATYHYDYRGSTVAITNASGSITDTFEYDTYGKLIGRTGLRDVIFGYNGRDGVITEYNGLIYMRARYYSPELRRFINADVVSGNIDNAITLNRYAYANGNPVSYIDPFGLSAERAGLSQAEYEKFLKTLQDIFAVSKKQKLAEYRIDIGSLTYYQNYELTFGSGANDIDKLIAGQIELSQSFDFAQGTFKRKTGTDILLGIEYSVDIDGYNSVSASVTFNRDGTMSAEYQISTEYTTGESLSTTMGIETNKNNTSTSAPIPDRVTEEEKEPTFWGKAGEVVESIGDGMTAFGDAMATAGEEIMNFGNEHPFLGVLIFGVLILIPGPQPI